MALKYLVANQNLSADQRAQQVWGITADSRKVKKNFLFAAFDGTQTAGAQFIDQAIEKGAGAILTSPEVKLPVGARVVHLHAPNPRRAYAMMASKFYPHQWGNPELPSVMAVTGTNGKTSVAVFARHIWSALGFKAAALGTLGLMGEKCQLRAGLTTPSADIIHRMLSGLARRAYQRVAMEASSHGLAQYRLDGVVPTAVVFTRLGLDHLDYHKNQENYFQAKMRLVKEILPPGGLFVCDDDAPGAKDALAIARGQGHKIIRVGEKAGVEVQVQSCVAGASGQQLSVAYRGQSHEINFPLAGRFQVVNALLAAAAVIGTEETDPAQVFATLESLRAVPGRLEKIAAPAGAQIFLDYAHTPDALESALGALRESLSQGGRLHLVFGAGGDRDKSKRPLMGRIAKRLADEIIITDDNPRFEDAAAIRETLAQSVGGGLNIADRAEAIAAGIKNLKPHDILLVAGKGHENYQERQGTQIEFSDAETIRSLLGG